MTIVGCSFSSDSSSLTLSNASGLFLNSFSIASGVFSTPKASDKSCPAANPTGPPIRVPTVGATPPIQVAPVLHSPQAPVHEALPPAFPLRQDGPETPPGESPLHTSRPVPRHPLLRY